MAATNAHNTLVHLIINVYGWNSSRPWANRKAAAKRFHYIECIRRWWSLSSVSEQQNELLNAQLTDLAEYQFIVRTLWAIKWELPNLFMFIVLGILVKIQIRFTFKNISDYGWPKETKI